MGSGAAGRRGAICRRTTAIGRTRTAASAAEALLDRFIDVSHVKMHPHAAAIM
jgi:hypothetical protein